MILVDSSVWIDFFGGRPGAARATLRRLLAEGEVQIVVPDLVLFEVLRGFRHDQDFHAARRTLAALPVVAIGGEREVQIEVDRSKPEEMTAGAELAMADIKDAAKRKLENAQRQNRMFA